MKFPKWLQWIVAPAPEHGRAHVNGIATAEALRALQERVLEVPAAITGGAPMRLRIRSLSRLSIEALRTRSRGDQEIDCVREGLIEPRVRFEPGGDESLPLWDDLPMAFRTFVATSIVGASYEGMQEVVKALRPFSGEDEVDTGDAGARAPSGQGVPSANETEHDSARAGAPVRVGPV